MEGTTPWVSLAKIAVAAMERGSCHVRSIAVRPPSIPTKPRARRLVDVDGAVGTLLHVEMGRGLLLVVRMLAVIWQEVVRLLLMGSLLRV